MAPYFKVEMCEAITLVPFGWLLYLILLLVSFIIICILVSKLNTNSYWYNIAKVVALTMSTIAIIPAILFLVKPYCDLWYGNTWLTNIIFLVSSCIQLLGVFLLIYFIIAATKKIDAQLFCFDHTIVRILSLLMLFVIVLLIVVYLYDVVFAFIYEIQNYCYVWHRDIFAYMQDTWIKTFHMYIRLYSSRYRHDFLMVAAVLDLVVVLSRPFWRFVFKNLDDNELKLLKIMWWIFLLVFIILFEYWGILLAFGIF